MFNSAVRFLASLVVVFLLLTYMWVNAANAAECTALPSGVVACDGSELPSAPRGTVKHRPATSVAHRIAAIQARRLGEVRIGHTVIIARLGAR